MIALQFAVAAFAVAIVSFLAACAALTRTTCAGPVRRHEPASIASPNGRPLDVCVHTPPPMPPIRDGGVFNRTPAAPFVQIGIVYSVDADKRLPLYGRPAPFRRHRYQYFVTTDTPNVHLAVRAAGRDCSDEVGCDELSSGDEVTIPELGDHVFRVKLAPTF